MGDQQSHKPRDLSMSPSPQSLHNKVPSEEQPSEHDGRNGGRSNDYPNGRPDDHRACSRPRAAGPDLMAVRFMDYYDHNIMPCAARLTRWRPDTTDICRAPQEKSNRTWLKLSSESSDGELVSSVRTHGGLTTKNRANSVFRACSTGVTTAGPSRSRSE